MKKPQIIFALTLFFFWSCEKEPIITPITPTTPPIVEKDAATDRAVPFEFSIQKTPCLVEKIQVSVDIENPNLYGFLWQVDGNKEGHLQKLEGCRCGTSATVTVTRFSDGSRIKKSIMLPQCNTTVSIVPSVEPSKELIPTDISTAIK